MWNSLLSTLKYGYKEKLLFWVGLPKSFSIWGKIFLFVTLMTKWFL